MRRVTPRQRRAHAVMALDDAQTWLLFYAENYAARATTTEQRMYRTRELLKAARSYSSALRRLARLRA